MIAGRIEALLHEAPVVDGHNDLPWSHRILARNDFGALDVGHDTTAAGLHTDLPRLRRGGVGAQFWSAFVPSTLPRHEAVTTTLEQIDTIHRMVLRYPDDLMLALSADDVEAARTAGRWPASSESRAATALPVR
jgi:membrane dipeptidase